MKKALCLALALILCVAGVVYFIAGKSADEKQFSDLKQSEIESYLDFAKNSINAYYSLRMSGNDDWAKSINKISRQTDDKDMLDDEISKVLDTAKDLIPNAFSNDIKEYMTAKLFYDTCSLVLSGSTEKLIDADYEVADWKIVDGCLICKINATVKFKYADSAADSSFCEQIQVVIENPDAPVITDWYCADPSSFDSGIRTFGLDLFEKENLIKNADKAELHSKLLNKCTEVYTSYKKN